MIVIRSWVAWKMKVSIGGISYRRVKYYWRGYFLFGLIPLLLVNFQTDYTE